MVLLWVVKVLPAQRCGGEYVNLSVVTYLSTCYLYRASRCSVCHYLLKDADVVRVVVVSEVKHSVLGVLSHPVKASHPVSHPTRLILRRLIFCRHFHCGKTGKAWMTYVLR